MPTHGSCVWYSVPPLHCGKLVRDGVDVASLCWICQIELVEHVQRVFIRITRIRSIVPIVAIVAIHEVCVRVRGQPSPFYIRRRSNACARSRKYRAFCLRKDVEVLSTHHGLHQQFLLHPLDVSTLPFLFPLEHYYFREYELRLVVELHVVLLSSPTQRFV